VTPIAPWLSNGIQQPIRQNNYRQFLGCSILTCILHTCMHTYIHTITLHCIALHCITYLPYYWEWLSHPFPRALHTSCHSQSKPPLIATVPPVTLWNLGTVCWSNHMSVDQSCWLVRYASFWSTNPSCRFNEMVWNARWNPPKFNQTCTEAGCAVRTRP